MYAIQLEEGEREKNKKTLAKTARREKEGVEKRRGRKG